MFTFTLARLPDEGESARITEIPGVRLRGTRISAPVHAAWIVDGALRALNLACVRVDAPAAATAPTWDACVARWESAGEVQPWTPAFALPYQRDGIALAIGRRSAHLWWPGGSGKTLAAILWALAEPGAVVIVTKAATRLQYASEVSRFTGLRACVLAPGARREGLPAYLARCAERGTRPVVVVGWQGLPAHVDALRALTPGAVVYDEAHVGKSSKRRSATLEADGSWSYADLDNIVNAAAQLARASFRRLATTATPIKDRRRDLWGQLDLVEPGAWGSFNAWAKRYCAAKPGAFGGWDTTGESNDAELLGRLSFVAHRVPYAISHRELPAKRRQSRYLGPDEQNAASGGWDTEIKRATARGASALLEARLAESASRKRKAVVEMTAEQVASGGGKVVVFTGRHRDCDALGAAMAKALPGVQVWTAHGGSTTPETREAVRAAYMEHPGPCVLVGTGDAWGTGYNLHDTDLAIFAMLPWTGGDLHQWEQRFARLGQRRPVLIVYAICEGSVDEQIADRLIAKIGDMAAMTGDDETGNARDALGGTDDREALAASLLARLADREIEVDDD
jgi:superfamily II DNA helicase RecQ